MACHDLLTAVWRRKDLDPALRAVVVDALLTTSPTLLLYWRSEAELARHLALGDRTVRRVFDRLRRAGVLRRVPWRTDVAGPRRSRACMYAVDVSKLDQVEAPNEHRADREPARRAVSNLPQGPDRTGPEPTEKRPQGPEEAAPGADDVGDKNWGQDVGDSARARATDPPPDDGFDLAEAEADVAAELEARHLPCDATAVREWVDQLTGPGWRVPRCGWALRAALRWVHTTTVGRVRYARDAAHRVDEWSGFDRAPVLQQARAALHPGTEAVAS